jgi:hypothetical protein
LDLVLALAPTALADEYIPKERVDRPQEVFPLDLWRCRSCGLCQVLEIIRAETIYPDYLYETKSSLGLVEHFRRYAKEVGTSIGPAPQSLAVDIGSNDGSLLQAFKDQGLRVLGVDPARSIAEKATKAGILTLPTFFTSKLAAQIRAEHGPATIITANNLYANVDDLSDLTDGIRSLLAPEGVFVFESFYLLDWIQNMVFDFMYHEHLSYFSVKPVQTFFRSKGMEVIDVKRVPSKGGSLRYTVKLAGGSRPADPSVAALVDEETRFGLDRLETYKAFAKRIDAVKEELKGILKTYKGQGKSIAGYGASATTTTLLYHFGIGKDLDYIVDDNKDRQGLYSPGLHIPVVSSDEMYTRKTDVLLILAWRYADPILKKHQAFADRGGRFVIPLPQVRVLPGP